MERTTDGGLLLNAQEVEGLLCLLLAEQRRVVDIHSTVSEAINDLVREWEFVVGPLPEVVR